MTAADQDAAYVEFDRVSKSFDGRALVVRDVDLAVRKGEFLTLLGPSGSGKTTCLMMLAGFETPTAGAIRIGGRPVENVPPRRRGCGARSSWYGSMASSIAVRDSSRVGSSSGWRSHAHWCSNPNWS